MKTKLTATVLAESVAGQIETIRWVYYNRIMTAKGLKGLEGSAAYTGKSRWYKIWLYMLGDHTYGQNTLPQSKKSQFKGFPTIKDFCTNNGYMKTIAANRAKDARKLIEAMFTGAAKNPYEGWEGQGNLADFNNESNNGIYWKRARHYFSLQQAGKVTETLVIELPHKTKKFTQFIFHAGKIQKYFKTHPLPDTVPKYTPK